MLDLCEKPCIIMHINQNKAAAESAREIQRRKKYENQKKLFTLVENSSTAQCGILKFVSSLISSEQLDDTFIDEISNLIDSYKKKDS